MPDSLGDHSNLEFLAASRNQLSGQIPSELGDLSNLEYLSLWGNPLGGTIPASLGGLNSLEVLLLFQNRLTGPIPPELGNLAKLRRLFLVENELSGDIPATLGELTGLQALFLGQNPGLTGCVPGEVLLLPVIDDGSHDIETLGLPLCPTPAITSVQPGNESLTVRWDAPAGFDDGIRSYDLRHMYAQMSSGSPGPRLGGRSYRVEEHQPYHQRPGEPR